MVSRYAAVILRPARQQSGSRQLARYRGRAHVRRVDVSRRKRVYADLLRAQLASHAPAHLQNCALRRVVRYPSVVLATGFK